MRTSYVNQAGESRLKRNGDFQPQRLLCTPNPQPDESLMGYILRLTEENRYETPFWIFALGDVGPLKSTNRWTQIYRTDINFTSLERVLGLEHSEFETMRWRLNNTEHSVWGSGNQIPSRLVRFNSPKICPACLRQANYCRKVWDLLLYTACPFHEALLIDICPSCDKRLMWLRARVSICGCGYDWRESKLQRISKSEQRISRLLYRVCGYSLHERLQFEKTNNPLDDLTLDEICHVLLFFAEHDLVTTAVRDISGLVPNAVRHDVLSSAYSIFDNWPRNFCSFVGQTDQQVGETQLMSQLHRSISIWCDTESLFFIIVALEEYIEKTFQERISKDFAWFPLCKRFINKEEAGCRLSLNQASIDVLIDQGTLEIFKKSEDDTDILVDRVSICRLQSRPDGLISVWRAAEELNVMTEDVLDLVRYECLIPLSGPEVKGSVEWKFYGRTLWQLIWGISNKTVGAKASAVDELIRSDDVFRYLKERGLSVGRFIRAIFDDLIAPQGEVPGRGLSRFIFSRGQVVEYVTSLHSHRAGRKMTLREVADFLNIKWAENSLIHSNKGLEFHCPLTLAKVAKLLYDFKSVS
jgi:hypothetical protein